MAMDLVENARTARELCEKSLWLETLAFAQKWHAENPADSKALFYMGLGFAGLGQFVQAETSYRRALEIDPSDAKIWNNLAKILFENLKRPMDGILCIEQTLKLNPANKLGWSNLAVMVGKLGREVLVVAAMLACARAVLFRGISFRLSR